MCVRKLKRFFLAVALPVLFLVACSEMDTILPSSVTYKVSALVGKISLDDYSVIGKDDAVQPVFVSSVVNDPDLTGLLVYLQDPEGEDVGGKVYYLLKTAEDPAEDPYQGPLQVSGQNPAQDPYQNPPKEPPQSPERDTPQNPVEDQTQDPLQDAETGENTLKEDTPKKEEKTEEIKREVENPPVEGEIVIRVSRLDKDLPAFPFPENLKIGNYSLVFEALGEKQTLYRTERHLYYIGDAKFALGDIQGYLPWPSAGSYLIPPGLTVMLETQVSADERLDPYIVWYDGKRQIAEGRIADGTSRFLWEAPAQTGFHTIRAEVFPLNPAGVSFRTGNSRTTSRSSVPELRGKVKELALPVSAKGGKPGFSTSEGEEVLHWYQFAGNLRDSMESGNRGKDLAGSSDLLWVSSEGIYGLSVKTGDTYQLPRSFFVMDKDRQGGGCFFLRVKPVAEGTLFTGSFRAAGSGGDTLTMSIIYQEQSLQLILESEGLKAAGSLPLDVFEDRPGNSAEYPTLRNFIAVKADFCVRENIFVAALNIEEGGVLRGTNLPGLSLADPLVLENLPAGLVRIELSRPLTGEINSRLGTPYKQSPRPAASREFTAEKADKEAAPAGIPAQISVSAEQSSLQRDPYTLAIFDEFALVFRKPASGK
jgi:hypothetical protein